MASQKIMALAAVGVTAIILTLATSALLSPSQNSAFDGTVSAANVGVYTNSACTTNCTSISLGDITPGKSKTYPVYVKNTGTVPLTLSMTTSEWNPTSANGPITLTWDREDYNLNAGASINAILTLNVSSSISTSITAFSLNVTIQGTQ